MDYVGPEDILILENREAVRLQGRTMPLVRLGDLLDLRQVETGAWIEEVGLPRHLATGERGPKRGADMAEVAELEDELRTVFHTPSLGTGVRLENKLPGVVVGASDRQMCFLVDELIDELDVVVKNLGPLLSRVDLAIGATILGNGRVVIILDVPSLLSEARSRSNRGQLSQVWHAGNEAREPRISGRRQLDHDSRAGEEHFGECRLSRRHCDGRARGVDQA